MTPSCTLALSKWLGTVYPDRDSVETEEFRQVLTSQILDDGGDFRPLSSR